LLAVARPSSSEVLTALDPLSSSFSSSSSDVVSAATAASWQSTFRQILDFRGLGHARYPPRLASWLDAQRRRYGPYVTTAIAGGRTTVATTRGVVQLGIIGHRVRQLNLIGIDWSGVTTAEIAMDKNVDDNDGDNDDDCNGQQR
jgi:hypothetical protein